MSNDSWATPKVIYNALDREFNFCADMAASEENHKHDIYWTEKCAPKLIGQVRTTYVTRRKLLELGRPVIETKPDNYGLAA